MLGEDSPAGTCHAHTVPSTRDENLKVTLTDNFSVIQYLIRFEMPIYKMISTRQPTNQQAVLHSLVTAWSTVTGKYSTSAGWDARW